MNAWTRCMVICVLAWFGLSIGESRAADLSVEEASRFGMVDPVTLGGQSATLLPDGTWLLVGGEVEGSASGTISTYNPITDKTIAVGTLVSARAWHSATMLPSGKVLVFGGIGVNRIVGGNPELIDLRTKLSTPLAESGLWPRAHHVANVLTDGSVLFAGGTGPSAAQLWDPVTETVITVNEMLTPRLDASSTLLSTSPVLIYGGTDRTGKLAVESELYIPADHWFEPADSELLPPVTALLGTTDIAESMPSDGGTDVPLDTRIAVRFNRRIDVRSLNSSTVSLLGPAGLVTAMTAPVEKGMLLFITPTQELLPGSFYTAFIRGATDTQGAVLPLLSISFSTTTLSSDVRAPVRPTQSPGTLSIEHTPAAPRASVWQPPRPSTWLRGSVASEGPGNLAALQADRGVTALAGQVLLQDGSALAGVAVSVPGHQVVTDATGRFLITPVPTGHVQLVVDGRTANTSSTQYGQFVIGADIRVGVTNTLGYTIWMPVIDTAHAVNLPSPTTKEVDVTSPLLPGVVLKIPAGVVLREPNGRIATTVSLTPVPLDRSPFPIPPFSMYFVIQPGGAVFESVNSDHRPGVQIIYPNRDNRPAGAPSQFMYYDPSGRGWTTYGRGHVSRDRNRIDLDGDRDLPGMSGFGDVQGEAPAPSVNPPVDGCNSGGAGNGVGEAADPVDCATGLFLYKHVDMVVPDTIPIVIRRTYQSSDNTPRNFGMGFSFDYNMYLYSSGGQGVFDTTFTTLNLVQADGSFTPCTRTAQSPPTGLTGIQMVCNTAPSATFYGAMITYQDSTGLLILTSKDGTQYTFNAADGRYLRSITNRNGQTLQVIVGGAQTGENYPVVTLISPNGRWVTIQNGGGWGYSITKITDNSGRSLNYAYDSNARLTKVTYPDGGFEQYTYDGTSNRIQSVILPNGQTKVTNVYDTNGRVSQQTLADGGVYHFAYILNGNGQVTTTTVTDPKSNVRILNFNTAGYVTSETLASGTSVQQVTTFQRDPISNFVVSKTDPLNRTTTFVYDAKGNVAQANYLVGTANAVTYGYTYTPTFNELATLTDPLSHTTTLGYDNFGDLTSITDGLNHVIATIAYNTATGLPTMVTDALSHSTSLGYQGSDLTSITDALGRVSTRGNDMLGRVLTASDPLGNKKSYVYDSMSRIKQITDAIGAVTTLTYDLDGNLKTVTDAKSNLTQYTYDLKDRLKTRTDPLNHVETYVFDVNDNLTSRTDRKSQQRVLSYDPLNRLSQVQYKTGAGVVESTVAYTYDAGNRATTINDSAGGTITRVYDGLDRLTSEASANGSVAYLYDGANRRTQLTASGQTAVTYGYDSANRLTSVTQGTANVTVGFDNANRRTSLTLPNGIILTYGYDNANELTGLTYKQGTVTVGSLAYAYDGAGRLTNRSGTLDAVSLPAALTTTTLDANNRLTKWGTTTLTYDLNGNFTGDGTHAYTWNTRDQLIGATGTHSASFAYDGAGRRTTKTIDGTTRALLYDGLNLTQELSAGTAVVNYLNGGNLDEVYTRTDSTSTRDVLTDSLGSALALTDSSGAIQTSYTYEPYGNATASGSASTNTLQYTGRENDGTGLYYYRARYYSPALSRFVSEDPIGFAGGMNSYAYAGGNPISNSDPMGLTYITNWNYFWDWFFGWGSSYRSYGPNDVETQEMEQSVAAQQMRDAFHKAGCQNVNGLDYGTVEAYVDTAVNPLTADWGGTPFEVGGFAGGSVVNNGNGTATYSFPNVSGTHSFFFHLVPDRQSSTGMMRNITQRFTWTESTSSGCGC
jgi:RHS repeat-associated protein